MLKNLPNPDAAIIIFEKYMEPTFNNPNICL